MKKKGFTLIELLVVIAIIAMLLAILMPALSKVKKIAQRVVCGTNLKGLGTAQNLYAHDANGQYAVLQRGATQVWAGTPIRTEGWNVAQKLTESGRQVTVGASLYLLVRQADVSPKSFVCPAGSEVEFSGRNELSNLDIVELWDFGNQNYTPTGGVPEGPQRAVSYSYHMPYGTNGARSTYAADGSRSAAFAVMADKNPFFDLRTTDYSSGGTAATWTNCVGRMAAYYLGGANPSKSAWETKVANSHPHDREGQNILYADGHTSYENSPDAGVMNDNIYLIRGGAGTDVDQIRRGMYGNMGNPGGPAGNLAIQPVNRDDSYLVNDSTSGY